MEKRIIDLAQVHHIREQLVEKAAAHQKKIKEAFDKKEKIDNFQVGDWVLKWDLFKEKKGNHGKFDDLVDMTFCHYSGSHKQHLRPS